MKSLSLRLDRETADRLEAFASTHGLSESSVIREAIDAYVARKRLDPKFRQRCRDHIARFELLISDPIPKKGGKG